MPGEASSSHHSLGYFHGIWGEETGGLYRLNQHDLETEIMSNDNHYFGVEIMLQHDLETEDSKPGNKYKGKIKWRLTAANEILVV